jgi:hypothetical protein
MANTVKKDWLAYLKAVKKYVKDLDAWIKSKTTAEFETLDEGGGSNPPVPPTPPKPPGEA